MTFGAAIANDGREMELCKEYVEHVANSIYDKDKHEGAALCRQIAGDIRWTYEQRQQVWGAWRMRWMVSKETMQ